MNKLAYLLITIGFVGGAFVGVLDPTEVNWTAFGATAVVGVIGVFLLRRSRHHAASASHKLDAEVETLRTSLNQIAQNLDELRARGELPAYEVRFDIDRLFREDLTAFAEARESMIHRFGLRQYADVMSAFAAGERYINRVWSASTDGYEDEVRKYIERARAQFTEACELFHRLRREAEANNAVSASR